MIPILYEGTETSFTSNGIGRLSDAISCTVTENRNGAYELEMEYPIDGVHFSDISLGKYIFAKPAKYSNKQAFEIYQITRPINGVCTIYAYHISYRLSKIPVMPFSTNSVTAALSGLVTNAAETNPFTFTTTKTTVANYNQTEPRDARSCLGGVQGSILDVFGGGDYEFDMFNVKLWQNRGQDRGFQIRYGKNLTDIKQEESIEDTITGIVPFYKNESTTITLPEKVISTASASNFPYPRTIPVDLSSEFQDSVPTVTQLRNAGNAYIASHSIGVPKVSLDVSFVNLADMVGYEDIAILEDVRLCDTVKVIFEKLGVSASAKVVSTEWDVLKDKFNKVGLGSTSNSLANKIANIEKVQTESSSFLEDAIQRATNLITGESGGYVVIHNNSDGKPYEILIMDNEDIEQAVHVWRWNKSGWGYSSTGYNGTYSLAATIDGGIVADFIKAGTIQGIAYNNGNGTFQVDSSGNLRATSAYISGDIVGSDITGSTYNNGNGTFQVDSSGNLTASSATITGQVKARTGYIGTDAAGFEIDENNIHKGKISLTDANSGVYIGANGIALGPSSKFRVDSAGNMIATSGKFSGDVTGSKITGSTLETRNGIKITNSAIEFTQDINALRYQFSDSIYTTIAQTGYDEVYNLVTKICDGVISHYAIPAAGGQRMMIFASADSGFYFRFENLVIFRQELRTVADINCGATITAAGIITGAQIHSKGAIQVHKGSSQYGNIDYDASAGNFNFQNESSGWANLAAANFIQASSRLVKDNIEDIEDAEKILELRPVEFDYKFGGHSYGFIAEEVEEVLPNLVHTPKDYDEKEVIDGDYTKSKKLAYDEFIPYLVKMIQKQQEEINELKERGK